MLTSGTKLGPYEVVGSLGAGGMGEVYRATDTRLKRQVAIKILPPLVAGDSGRLARFQREAEVLASLNHPQIAAVYGLEESESGKALVMELVEGPTLADRIAGGALPVDEALPIARQIAAALEAAHEQGIVHRDLKPANIKVREDGTVKVLDFGLANYVAKTASADSATLEHSPTLASPTVTQAGVILGTAAYMSPEQARGRSVDKRSDIWAFGAVFYEMLTGTRAFSGEDATELISAVVKGTPDWARMPADVPPPVVTLIQRCLEKDRQARVGDIAVARFLLTDHAALSSASAASPPAAAGVSSWRRTLPWLAVAVAAGAVIGWLLPRPAVDGLPTHVQVDVVPAEHLVTSIASPRPSRTPFALSPDGRVLVFSATKAGETRLYARTFDRTDATPMPGTEGGESPFFSPDGRSIAFWSGGALKKTPVAGGPPVTITEIPGRRLWGAAWGADDAIVFGASDGIFRVASAGGTPEAVTTRDASKGERHLSPQVLPGGHLLFTTVTSNGWDTANVVVRTRDGGEQRVLIPGGSDGRYLSTGQLLYMKSGTLFAVPFDAGTQQLAGSPVALIEGVMHAINTPNSADQTGAGQYTVSASGTLIYLTGGISPLLEGTLVWMDRKGVASPPAAPSGPYLFSRLSPDGQKVAVTMRRIGGPPDLWVYDLPRGAPTRLTFEGTNAWPVWSPDGKRIVYGSSAGGGAANLHIINADGSGRAERLTTSDATQQPSSWAPTTDSIAFLQRTSSGGLGIWVLPMSSRQPSLFLESSFFLSFPEFSPDGGWMAYVSNESGTPEVYVQSYPRRDVKVRISVSGGTEPIWSADGRELLYRTEGHVWSARIRSLSPFAAEAPRVIVKVTPGEYDSTTPIRSWDVSHDGQRFLFSRLHMKEQPITAMHVVFNWTEELKRRLRNQGP